MARVPDHWLPKNQQPATAAGRIADLSFGQLTQMLGAHFLPASVMAPPMASGGNGNRRTVLTNQDNLGIRPMDTKLAAFVAGSYVWTFVTKFNSQPVVFAFPIGTPPVTGTTPAVPTVEYTAVVSVNAATINSYLATDTRMVMLLAVGNPS